ncbi:S24 family peptidase [Dyella sp. BiH032]|uniref:S24 family peptidase n=1 Tax=Dyella sp. BiH032 TaxID=3075430 RepID=UPI002892AEF2|nr:S24 family peptidase [Dyella sp. BiH032]WNL46521.1 S24 family peptidase [Dyella sp. BiH032]
MTKQGFRPQQRVSEARAVSSQMERQQLDGGTVANMADFAGRGLSYGLNRVIGGPQPPGFMRPVRDIRRSKLAQLERESGTPAKLADRIGKNRAQVYQWLAVPKGDDDRSSRDMSDETARDIEQRLGLPAGWMDNDDSPADQGEQVSFAILASHIEPGGAHTVSFPRQLFATRRDLLEPHIRVAWIHGDDMKGEIEVGELVFIDTTKNATPPAHDGVYAFTLGEVPLIKRIKKISNGGFRVQGSRPQKDAIDLYGQDLSSLVVEGRIVSKLVIPGAV